MGNPMIAPVVITNTSKRATVVIRSAKPTSKEHCPFGGRCELGPGESMPMAVTDIEALHIELKEGANG